MDLVWGICEDFWKSLSWELKDAGKIRVRGGTGQIEVCQAEGTARTKALRWDRWRAWRWAEYEEFASEGPEGKKIDLKKIIVLVALHSV